MASTIAARRQAARERRHARVRRRVTGTSERPRLCVFRSHQHIYAQVIDDGAGATLAAASTVEPGLSGSLSGKTKREQAAVVGETVAERAKAKGVMAVVFDRGGYDYHGRIRELAEAARKAGLAF